MYNNNLYLFNLINSITEIPAKTGVYATLTSLLNSNSYEFGVEIISTTCDAMEDALKNGKWTTVKLLVNIIYININFYCI